MIGAGNVHIHGDLMQIHVNLKENKREIYISKPIICFTAGK